MDTFMQDGHEYHDNNGHIYESTTNIYVGEVFKSPCDGYWIFDGDASGQIHENEPSAYVQARGALIASLI